MAQLAYNISNELLSCKICFCQFTREKLPKLLSCPHTFCEPCLTKMVRRTRHTARAVTGGQASSAWDTAPPAGQVDNITCPVCREVTTLKEQGVQGLANNLTILTLMDMIVTPGLATSPTRNRLESPEEGMGRCVQCNKRFPESQYLCGHCICDRCLDHYLRAFGHNDQCPVCKPSPRVRGHSRSPTPDAPPSGACGTSPAPDCRPKQITPIPAPRMQQRHTNSKATDPFDEEDPPLKPSNSDNYSTGRNLNAPARPPPFNPTYLTASGGGASANSSSSPELHETTTFKRSPKRSVSPYGAGAGAAAAAGGGEPLRYHRRFTDPDNVSLCSVASESRVSPHRSAAAAANSPSSTLRRTQSMRRPPPPPQRKYGTLQRQTLAPPQPAMLSRSAENVRGQQAMAAASAAAGRQRHSLSEGSGGPQGPPAPAGISPPVPPPRRIFNSQNQSPTRCVKKFGSYSEVTMQTSCFRTPGRIALSEKGDIVVADTRNMTVQVFTMAGDYLAMFKVLGVADACFITVDKLCVASHMGVHIYTTSGQKIADIQIGPTVAVAPYTFGFIAATPKSLHIYRQSFTLVKEITKFKSASSKKWSPIHKKTQKEFHSIRDIAVTPNKNICVLDGGSSWTVHILGEDGCSSAKIDPVSLSCGALSDPESIATDFANNIYVSDTEQHRVLRFTNAGVYQKCVVSFSGRDPNTKKIFPRGICVTETGHVIVGITGDQVAEVRVYSQTS